MFVLIGLPGARANDAHFFGSSAGMTLQAPIVGMARTPTGDGYWTVGTDGGVFGFGGARFFGGASDRDLNQPIVGMAATPSGDGYWLVARDGGVFAFGDAQFLGSVAALPLQAAVTAMAATPSGNGYWVVAADGGVFGFGDAIFVGSTGAQALNQPIVAIATTPSGHGYWTVAADGGVFAFGDAAFHGSMAGIPLRAPIVAMAATPSGDGYWTVATDGGVFAPDNTIIPGLGGAGSGAAPAPGSVGANPDTITQTIDPPGGVLQLSGTQALSNVYVRGGIEFDGAGILTLRNVIVESGYGWDGFIRVPDGTLDVANSTVRVRANPSGLHGSLSHCLHTYGTGLIASRVDLSGCGVGIMPGDNTVVEESYIHDLHSYSGGHVDGIFSMGGVNMVFRNNRIDIGMDATTAAVFLQPWYPIDNVLYEGNYLRGGGFAIRAQGPDPGRNNAPIGKVRYRNNIIGPPPDGAPSWAGTHLFEGVSPVEWSGNVHGDAAGTSLGTPLPL